MILVQHLTKSHPDKMLFDDISFKVGDGQKVGLVGPNGVGKTTLLNLIAGKEEPDQGKVTTSGEKIASAPQKLVTAPGTEVGQYLTQFLTEKWETYRCSEVLAQVGLKNVPLKTLVSKLSGGQKMKLGLAGVLLQEPTTLFLDEPTNNLDVASIAWLELFVQNFPGKVLLISHDRYFLDACVDKIVELDAYTHKIQEYGGNYTAFVSQKSARQSHLEDDFERQQEKERHMKDWINKKQEQLKFHPNPKVARQLQAMKKRLEREVDAERLEKPKTYEAFRPRELGNELHQQKNVITLRNFHIPQLFSIPELFIFGQDRVQLLGPNGAGKTTLLRSILGKDIFYSGEVELGPQVRFGYFSQEHELLPPDKIMIDAFRQLVPNTSEDSARRTLGKYLFSKQRVFSLVRSLSEGEKARLHLAILINQHTDFLLLDEPTNHLDLESREVLATALQNYAGGFIVVSHDRYFIEQIQITKKLQLQHGEVRVEKVRQ